MYTGFLGLAGLSLLLWGHCVWLWNENERQLPSLTTAQKVFLALAAAVCVLALLAGVVLWVIRFDPAAVHVMGLAVLLSSLWFNAQVRHLYQ